MAKRVALYARVSTADQHSGLEAQIRALKEHCEKNKIEDYELYTDENFSGAKISRPSLDRMMAAVKRGEVSCVCVYSFSRFARSTTHLLTALEDMKKYETDFISLTERIETNSPMGRAFFTLTGESMPALENPFHQPIHLQIELNKKAQAVKDLNWNNSTLSTMEKASQPLAPNLPDTALRFHIFYGWFSSIHSSVSFLSLERRFKRAPSRLDLSS